MVGHSGRRVLIVDDEEDIRLWLRGELQRQGWEVREAGSGAEAIAAVRAERTDLIVLDQLMPAMTGLDAVIDIRDSFDGPIVLFSAHLERNLAEKARLYGVFPMSKVDRGALLRLLSRL